MEKALFHKFTEHQDLNKLLLDTGDAIIVEHTANDSYWYDDQNIIIFSISCDEYTLIVIG